METSQPVVIIFTGIQGSGKTFYYHAHLESTHVHINLDSLHTREKERQLFFECLRKKLDIVVDNTNPTVADRARYILPAKQAGYKIIGYYSSSCLEDCIRRNAMREGTARIPEKAIAATSNRMTLPDYAEGFDALYYIARDADDQMIQMEWRCEDEL